MRVFFALALLITAALAASSAQADYPVNAKGYSKVLKAKRSLNILLSNDDSWASANIRATYYALKTAGHKVLMVAPAQQQSGTGGTVNLPKQATLSGPGRGGSLPQSAPYRGANASDPGLTYFDGTPGACTLFGLDQVVPGFFKNKSIDLAVTGPNEGTNLGPFLYTLSGTLGASYVVVERGFPAIAFSASTAIRDYTTLNYDNSSDESIIIATDTANLVSTLGDSQKGRILPLGLGGSVNYGTGVGQPANCSKAKWIHTRMTGGAYIDRINIGSNGLPMYENIVAPGLNRCLSGDCSLPGEQDSVNKDMCAATLSIYVRRKRDGILMNLATRIVSLTSLTILYSRSTTMLPHRPRTR